MNCHALKNLLDLYEEGRLSPRRTKAVEAHLASCPACRALSARASGAPAAKAPEALKARLLAAAKAAHPAIVPSKNALPLWPRETGGIALAAVALALVAALISMGGVPSQSRSAAVAALSEEP
jgi:anti-sigma factor RsiW